MKEHDVRVSDEHRKSAENTRDRREGVRRAAYLALVADLAHRFVRIGLAAGPPARLLGVALGADQGDAQLDEHSGPADARRVLLLAVEALALTPARAISRGRRGGVACRARGVAEVRARRVVGRGGVARRARSVAAVRARGVVLGDLGGFPIRQDGTLRGYPALPQFPAHGRGGVRLLLGRRRVDRQNAFRLPLVFRGLHDLGVFEVEPTSQSRHLPSSRSPPRARARTSPRRWCCTSGTRASGARSPRRP